MNEMKNKPRLFAKKKSLKLDPEGQDHYQFSRRF